MQEKKAMHPCILNIFLLNKADFSKTLGARCKERGQKYWNLFIIFMPSEQQLDKVKVQACKINCDNCDNCDNTGIYGIC